jgi:hypothetical protein
MTALDSPLLRLPDAVAGSDLDAQLAAHYGSFTGEQRILEAGEGSATFRTGVVVRVSGPHWLSWRHSLTTQFVGWSAAEDADAALILSPQGHVKHALYGVDDGEVFIAHVEPGRHPALIAWLTEGDS